MNLNMEKNNLNNEKSNFNTKQTYIFYLDDFGYRKIMKCHPKHYLKNSALVVSIVLTILYWLFNEFIHMLNFNKILFTCFLISNCVMLVVNNIFISNTVSNRIIEIVTMKETTISIFKNLLSNYYATVLFGYISILLSILIICLPVYSNIMTIIALFFNILSITYSLSLLPLDIKIKILFSKK